MLAAFLPIPWVGCAFSYQARVGPSPKVDGGPSLNSFASPVLPIIHPASPTRHIKVLRCRRVCGQGGGAVWLVWCLHSTPQAATVRSRRLPFFSPVQNGIHKLNWLSFTSFCDDLFDYILFYLTRFDYFFFFWPPDPCCWLAPFVFGPGGQVTVPITRLLARPPHVINHTLATVRT